jgi:hypothetical protein
MLEARTGNMIFIGSGDTSPATTPHSTSTMRRSRMACRIGCVSSISGCRHDGSCAGDRHPVCDEVSWSFKCAYPH